MPDLTEQIQAAVGAAYRIERELGGGGMSRVFLAEEKAFGRRVVIKVLPPELAAGVSVERFRREIQVAASLQHPHIVQLLTAGAADGVLYYVMPFLPGESLRARLARESELPVDEAVRILRDVVDALAYAHAQGIVHRDVKPDNVLLAGKHALVTDFGVAKAVSSAGKDSALTSLGIALGTPAYMAPEQAAGDPNVDTRADLYAVGVVAYEMLTGRLPFLAPSPRAMLAAQVTTAPDPLIEQRPAVPPALNALVMRCLEKRPADRWQRAEDLLVALEAMATPAGGTGATAAAAAAISLPAAPLATALRVTGLFALASVAVLAVVYVLMQKLGLPDWVLAATAVLLAVGWPIMLTTGRYERQRELARTSGAAVVPGGGWRRWFTWRRTLWGGAAAFGGLALLVTLYTVLRLLGIGPVATLLAKGALKAREPIILSDFANHTADSSLSQTLTEAFRVDLSQSPTVRLVDGARIVGGLRRMQRAPGAPLTADLARELAQREGIKAVVTGEIGRVGQGYVLVASVVSSTDGAVLTGVREAAADDAGLIPALDRLSRALRERIGESLTTIRAKEPLEAVTTGSLEALEKYTAAIRIDNSGDELSALPLLVQATALDTGFAMAYRKIAVITNNTGGSTVQAAAAATHAFVHRDRLPPLERDETIAYYYSYVDYQPTQAIAAYRDALAVDSTDYISLNNLALLLMRQRQWAAAESLEIRGMASGRCGWSCASNAVVAQVGLGRFADAHATLDRYTRAPPGDPLLLGMRAEIAGEERDYAAAERFTRQLHDAQLASPFWREQTDGALATLAALQGHLTLAAQITRDQMAASEQRGLPDHYIAGAARLALGDVWFRNRPGDALKTLAVALARHPLEAIPAVDRPYDILAEVYVRAGRVDEARRLLAEYERVVPPGLRNGDSERHEAVGMVEAAEGRSRDALASFQADQDESGCDACGLFPQAEVYDKIGQPDSALARYERLVTLKGPFKLYATDVLYLAAAYKRLGELYEARHERKKAIEDYTGFVDLWKTADPDLQPVVRDVRARIARLSSEQD